MTSPEDPFRPPTAPRADRRARQPGDHRQVRPAGGSGAAPSYTGDPATLGLTPGRDLMLLLGRRRGRPPEGSDLSCAPGPDPKKSQAPWLPHYSLASSNQKRGRSALPISNSMAALTDSSDREPKGHKSESGKSSGSGKPAPAARHSLFSFDPRICSSSRSGSRSSPPPPATHPRQYTPRSGPASAQCPRQW